MVCRSAKIWLKIKMWRWQDYTQIKNLKAETINLNLFWLGKNVSVGYINMFATVSLLAEDCENSVDDRYTRRLKS